jgi:prepilin-type N-terminal cleavage/methylation domain-containing protein
MQGVSTNRGFSLFEVMVVVLIVGILAMMARTAIYHLNMRARVSTYQNDCRVLAAAFTQYAQEKGSFPADASAHTFPATMAGYMRVSQWMRVTPLGGYYEWDNINASNSLGVRFKAALRINGCTRKTSELQQIDKWIDDGNLTRGNFRVTDAGATVLYIIEP